MGRKFYSDGTEHDRSSLFSGFFWRHEADIFLITNWHNVTGLNAETKKNNGTFYPSHIEASFIVMTPANEVGQVGLLRRKQLIGLYDGPKPRWIEHPMEPITDVVAIPFPVDLHDGAQLQCLNECGFEERWSPPAGCECFVVGYPEGLEGPDETPIWKRASIATEPRLDHLGRPTILVDTLGNEGLSGSAVVAQSYGVFNPQGRELAPDAIIGSWQAFLGVYSGRLGDSGLGFQLGRVWKAQLIQEILQDGRPGIHPECPF